MPKRVDEASVRVPAPASAVYEAFATARAMEAWLPPRGMSGRMLAFVFREGGGYRMRLTYEGSGRGAGKTSEDADEVEVRFVKLVPGERIEQAVTFDSDDPAFAGAMRITWTFVPGPGGTLIPVRCEDVPAG